MFLNYLAGAVSLVLAVSAFIPWVTVWFYSLKGIDSIYGIGILVVGLLGISVSVFQHLSGKIRGRAFIFFSIVALLCEGLYFQKLASYGSKLNDAIRVLKIFFGDAVVQKVQQLLGEQWTIKLVEVGKMFGVKTSISSFDFLGGGMILAAVCSIILLIVGILLEKNKAIPE